jgi:small subunit ribosomal protein S21
MIKKSRKNYKNNHKQPQKGGDNQAATVNGNNHVGPGEAIQAQPLEVKVYGNNFDKALRAFRALVQKERILSTYKERQSYEKPSDKRRRKINESKRKQLEMCNKGECRHSEHSKNHKERPNHTRRNRSSE